ncbi:hypothetical protein BDY19DRAFT_704747 [Irpex rosettiformis]|uniref:Uncharacterized protein n=1 Tax=Irpex rosettiformis TaxID=378272 RepID=A0ACB8TMU3_9APHY|nr:hypothetical protein BDY19DRAFT_704747 [Irpex rosettiformis]
MNTCACCLAISRYQHVYNDPAQPPERRWTETRFICSSRGQYIPEGFPWKLYEIGSFLSPSPQLPGVPLFEDYGTSRPEFQSCYKDQRIVLEISEVPPLLTDTPRILSYFSSYDDPTSHIPHPTSHIPHPSYSLAPHSSLSALLILKAPAYTRLHAVLLLPCLLLTARRLIHLRAQKAL